MRKSVTDKILLGVQLAAGVIYVILAVFAIKQAALPADESKKVSDSFTATAIETILEVFDNDGDRQIEVSGQTYSFDQAAAFLRKLVGHFGLFAAMSFFGFIFCTIFKNKTLGALIDLSAGFCVSIITEAIQLFASGRAGSVSDVVLNTLGIVMIICLLTAASDIYTLTKKKPLDRRSLVVLLTFTMFSMIFLSLRVTDAYTLFCYEVYTVIGSVSSLASVVCMLIYTRKKR